MQAAEVMPEHSSLHVLTLAQTLMPSLDRQSLPWLPVGQRGTVSPPCQEERGALKSYYTLPVLAFFTHAGNSGPSSHRAGLSGDGASTDLILPEGCANCSQWTSYDSTQSCYKAPCSQSCTC